MGSYSSVPLSLSPPFPPIPQSPFPDLFPSSLTLRKPPPSFPKLKRRKSPILFTLSSSYCTSVLRNTKIFSSFRISFVLRKRSSSQPFSSQARFKNDSSRPLPFITGGNLPTDPFIISGLILLKTPPRKISLIPCTFSPVRFLF